MTIPLWLPWALLVATAVPALRAWQRLHRDAGEALFGWAWASAVIAVVALVVSVDDLTLSSAELRDGLQTTATQLSGTVMEPDPDRFAPLVSELVGHTVVADVVSEERDENSGNATIAYAVHRQGQESLGICLVADGTSLQGVVTRWYLYVTDC